MVALNNNKSQEPIFQNSETNIDQTIFNCVLFVQPESEIVLRRSDKMPDLSKPQIIPYAEESVDMTLFDCRWVPCSTRFAVMGTHLKGNGVLRVYTLDLEKKGIKMVTEGSTEHPIKCGSFGATTLEERHLATGDFKVSSSCSVTAQSPICFINRAVFA